MDLTLPPVNSEAQYYAFHFSLYTAECRIGEPYKKVKG